MDDRPEVTRRAARAFDAAASRLAEHGVSDLEAGRAMLASGLARLALVMPAADLSSLVAEVAPSIRATGASGTVN